MTLFFICYHHSLFALAIEDLRSGLPNLSHQASIGEVELGRKLFFDKRLSANGTVSCGECHQPDRSFSDGKKLAEGINGEIGTRNTPSIINAIFNQTQFWDGRRQSLEDQAIDPFINKREHGFSNYEELLSILRQDRAYVIAFRNVYHIKPKGIQVNHIGKAIAGYERTLVVGNSAFDKYFFKGEKSALTENEVNGLKLFQGVAGCANCHSIEKTHALFSDNLFHSLNVGLDRIARHLPELTAKVVMAKKKNVDEAVFQDKDIAELGRFVVTLNPIDIGAFRTPSLRNVALTAPYMHDGSVETLEAAVDLEIYYRGAESGRPLILTKQERLDLVAFLRTLSSPRVDLP